MSPLWFPGIVHAGDMPDPASPPRASSRLWPALAATAVIVVSAIALRLQGRFWICSCGEIYLWAGDIWSADNSQHVADPYTWTHLLHGIAFFWILAAARPRLSLSWRLALAVSLESVWEIVENSRYVIERYRDATIALGYTGDTIVNSMGDIATCAAGFLLAASLGMRRSIYAFGLTELLLVVWIRDSLLLNILMLIYPIEAIRAWQMG